MSLFSSNSHWWSSFPSRRPPRHVQPPLFKAVLALVVSAKIYLPLEAFGTDLTAERLESGVFATVCDEVGALAEGFATHLAFVRLLTCKKKT